ncbi:MAG TPA: hypothetical protein VKM55_01250 [Candidatus Lokiarchaeia archaeon]|nr:hypothetical protein [Candidatus Lokiarchaeia archaeon]
MNVFVLKGTLLDANLPGSASSPLKDRVFDAISFPGFINSTYDVIGVEFGLGIMEIDAPRNEQSVVKIQVWNLNDGKNFILNWRHFLKGSRFAIITFNLENADLANLEAIMSDCKERCPDINIGIVGLVSNEDLDIDTLPAMLEEQLAFRANVVRNIEEMMTQLVSNCIENEHVSCILPVHSINDIQRVTAIQNPFFNYLTKVSDNLIHLFDQLNIQIDKTNNIAILEKPDYTYHVDLNKSALLVASRNCSECPYYPCKDCFAKICVVLDSQLKRGFATEELGLSQADLFVLSMVFSIENNKIPTSISSQFPKNKPCSRKK